jgi:hypothetical protein
VERSPFCRPCGTMRIAFSMWGALPASSSSDATTSGPLSQMNSAHAHVCRSNTRHTRRVLVPTLYVGHSSGPIGFVRLKNAAFESYDVRRKQRRSG